MKDLIPCKNYCLINIKYLHSSFAMNMILRSDKTRIKNVLTKHNNFFSSICIYGKLIIFYFFVRPEKFKFLEKGQNRNFGYKIIISVKKI